ncbi:hypothetical protein EVG20_g5516 [Dentipellis fragilis]|uniref:F-box domain-containing protein n=1 Tax=Dentipellis fragilis TaxID=205917 RepID=A0A4Y9YVH0_9AGAM|nr:hypothetical protein EVG20_g5516 [Dentipellis fragilis]
MGNTGGAVPACAPSSLPFEREGALRVDGEREHDEPEPHAPRAGMHVARERAACATFIETVTSSPRGRRLADNVRTLQVLLDPAQPGCLRAATFARAFSVCPNISTLDIALYSAPSLPQSGSGPATDSDTLRTTKRLSSFDAETIALLASPRARGVTKLAFANWTGAESECGEFFQLLALLPDLKHLALRGAAPVLPPATTARYAGAIEELELNVEPSSSPALFTYLLRPATSAPTPVLRSLKFARQPSPELLDVLLAAHGAGLTSLAIPSLPTKSVPELRRIFGYIPGLRRLEVKDPWAGASLFRRAQEALPASLTDVAIGVDDLTPLHALVEYMRPRDTEKGAAAEERDARMPLESITLLLAQGGEKHPLIPVLRKVCDAEEVELDIVNALK